MGQDEKQERVRSLKGRFGPLKFMLYASIAGHVLVMIADLYYLYMINVRGQDPYLSDDPAFLPFLLLTVAAAGIAIIALLLSVVFVCLWTYRAMKNLHIIDSPEVHMSPAWAVGWHFIPFANWFQPFAGMSQIWRGSHRAADLTTKIPAMMGFWWALWVILNILSNISMRMGGWDGSGELYDLSIALDVVTAPFWIICTFLLLKITSRITRIQDSMQGSQLLKTFE